MTLLTGLSWDLPHGRGYLSLLSVVSAGLLLAGVTALWVPGIGWGLAVLGAQYGARLALDPAGTETWAPLFAVALLAVGELCYLSLEIRSDIRAQLRGRLARVAILGLGSAAAAELVLLAAAFLPLRGFFLVVAGAGAVVVLLAALGLATNRSRISP